MLASLCNLAIVDYGFADRSSLTHQAYSQIIVRADSLLSTELFFPLVSRAKSLSFSTMIPNVETLIKSEALEQSKAARDGKVRAGEMTWDAYQDLDTMYAYFDKVAGECY